MQQGFAYTKLADRLKSIAELSDDDLKLLTSMPCTIAHFASHARQIPVRHHAFCELVPLLSSSPFGVPPGVVCERGVLQRSRSSGRWVLRSR